MASLFRITCLLFRLFNLFYCIAVPGGLAAKQKQMNIFCLKRSHKRGKSVVI